VITYLVSTTHLAIYAKVVDTPRNRVRKHQLWVSRGTQLVIIYSAWHGRGMSVPIYVSPCKTSWIYLVDVFQKIPRV
jgi:hypothetical protein